MITPFNTFIELINAHPACDDSPKCRRNDLPPYRRASYSPLYAYVGEGLARNRNGLVLTEPTLSLSQWLRRVDMITALKTERARLINEQLGEEELVVMIT